MNKGKGAALTVVSLTPVDDAIDRQGSALERPKTEKGIETLFVNAIYETFLDPQDAIVELFRLGLTKSEICKKLNLRFRWVERVLGKVL